MKRTMLLSACLACLGFAGCLTWQLICPTELSLALAITMGTILYHLAMRLTVGGVIHLCYRNHMNFKRRWFSERPFEKGLYRFLRVAKWGKRVPTFAPESFQWSRDSIEDLIGVTCQAETVHEIIMVLSLLPIVATVWFDALPAFLITSILSCLYDSTFVIVQRFNRPKLLRLLEHRAQRDAHKKQRSQITNS